MTFARLIALPKVGHNLVIYKAIALIRMEKNNMKSVEHGKMK